MPTRRRPECRQEAACFLSHQTCLRTVECRRAASDGSQVGKFSRLEVDKARFVPSLDDLGYFVPILKFAGGFFKSWALGLGGLKSKWTVHSTGSSLRRRVFFVGHLRSSSIPGHKHRASNPKRHNTNISLSTKTELGSHRFSCLP